MQLNRSAVLRAVMLVALMANLTFLSSRIHADTGSCGGATTTLPFTDVQGNIFFCHIAAAYFSGLTAGTSATTYGPTQNVTREQMAAFTTRTLDQSLKRGSQRAALDQYWTTQGADNLGVTPVGLCAELPKSDGADIWVPNRCSNTVSRVRASDGKLLETWTGASVPGGVLCAMGKVFVTGSTTPSGNLYQIDPKQPAGGVTVVSNGLGEDPHGIAFDGQRIWTANSGIVSGTSSVSIVTLNPISVTNVSTGFSSLYGILYDGANIWVVDTGDDMLKKLDTNGVILQSIPVGNSPRFPVFDGVNIWVPNQSDHSISVVRASTGTVLATLTGNGLLGPLAAAFDSERILVTNFNGDSVSLWKAVDLTPLGTFSTGANSVPFGVCSDGMNFWVTLTGTPSKLARF